MFKWVSNFFEPTYSDYHIIKDYEQKVKKVKDKALVELKKSGEEDEKLETYTESLRFEREPLLLALDIEFQRALENGADTTAIVAEKQRLRDITNLTDSCTTFDELRVLHC